MSRELDHPVYARRRCPGCGTYVDGMIIPPKAKDAETVVLYLCPQCDVLR